MHFLQSLRHKPTHHDVWSLAGPMILSNLTVPLLGMVDTAVVGHLHEPHYLGAVAVGAMIFGVVFWGFGFLRMGTTGLTAQALGAVDYVQLRAWLARALLLAMGFSGLLLVLQIPIADLAFYLMRPSELVEQQGRIYFTIRIASAPATLANYVIIGWFLGLQNARVPLLLLLVVNSVNMLLDVVMVMGLQFGADGVAWASLCAEYCGLVLGLLLVRNELHKYPGAWRMTHIFDGAQFRRMLSVNRDILIRTLCLMFTLAFFTAQGARMGEVILAANAVLFNFQTFMAYGLDGFAHAAEALVGKATGARDQAAFRRSVHIVFFWALLISTLFAFAYAVLGEYFIAMLTDIQEVRQTAEQYLIWVIVLPLVSIWSFSFDGIYLGATRTIEMRNTMLISTLAVFLPAWYGLQSVHNHGLWMAFVLFMCARAVTMAWVYGRLQRRGGFMA
jgi:MATE family multidrug resistance protein